MIGLTEAQVVRLQRVLPNLARGAKRHPETAAAMTALAGLLRMCARCGETAVLGGPDDLTCCDRCASQVGYDVAAGDVDQPLPEPMLPDPGRRDERLT